MSRANNFPSVWPAGVFERVEQHWTSLEEVSPFFASVDDKVRNSIQRVWACSEFAAHYCIHNPSQFERIFQSGRLEKKHDSTFFAVQLGEFFADIADEIVLMQRLREIRNEEMFCMVWRDLLGLADLDEILLTASDLADGLTGQALDWLYTEQCGKVAGTPRDDMGQAQQLVVLGLGKLGGRELNFSSDIDLIFAFASRGSTDGVRPIANEAFFKLLGQRLIKVLNSPTANGFVFRVDMRLRPFGDSGALATSFDAMEGYYQSHGREWERYALIKARVIAGDKVAGEALLNSLQGFIYRRYLDYGAIESLREMKALISREAARKNHGDHLKLGPGGIREIEFITQLFQLIHGGRDRHMRRSSLQPVLKYLWERELLPEFAVDELEAAYRFLRRAENHVQMMDDRQIHVLPEKEQDRWRLAVSLGYEDWEAFYCDLEQHRRRVNGHFQQVFAAPQLEENVSADTRQAGLTTLWQMIADGALEQADILSEAGYEDAETSFKALQTFAEDRHILALSEQGRQRLDRLMPLLISAVSEYADGGQVLQRLLNLLTGIAGRTAYLSLLGGQPMVLSQLIKLCAASAWLAEYLARHPILLDELIDPNALYAPPDRESLEAELAREFTRLDPDDQEQAMDRLRYFKQAQTLRVAAADIVGALPVTKVSDHLTWLAEVILEKALEVAWKMLAGRHGEPEFQRDGEIFSAQFIIVAYGKLGGMELGYGSDLDLVFIHDSRGSAQMTNGQKSIANAVFFTRLGQRLINLLSVLTPAGELYEIDMRLRPSGRSGLMVISMEAFDKYQRDNAWVWEHQALVRARAGAGGKGLRERFIQIRREILCRERDRNDLKKEVRSMREKMWGELKSAKKSAFNLKKSPGGITDIEFMVQYLVLAHAAKHPELCEWTDNIRILESLAEAGVGDMETMQRLAKIYQQMRDEIHRRLLKDAPVVIENDGFSEEREFVLQCWQNFLIHD
jgi:glutamate-ammonia-ligase adenylyltransferase